MKKAMDKLVTGLKINRKTFIFFVILGLIAIIIGSIFVVMLSTSDKTLIKDYLETFINNVDKGKLNYLEALKNISLSNYLYIVVAWLLGISVIGIPVIIFMYFMKCFMIGFSVAAIILEFKLKGLLFAFIYVFPHHIINLTIYTILMVYALTLSLKIAEAVLKKKSINFRVIINKYLFILIITLVIVTLTNLFEVYVTPILIKSILPLIN